VEARIALRLQLKSSDPSRAGEKLESR